MAQAEALAALAQAGPDAWWHAVADPIVHDWENNPGHALGGTAVTVATVVIPGGAALKGARAAKMAEEAAVGSYAEGLGASALTPGRLQHGTRHLTEAGVLPSWSGTSSPGIIERALTPILEHPTATFDASLGGTRVRGFLGDLGGQQVAVFVYKEGAYQGQLASSFVPNAKQLALWGVK